MGWDLARWTNQIEKTPRQMTDDNERHLHDGKVETLRATRDGDSTASGWTAIDTSRAQKFGRLTMP